MSLHSDPLHESLHHGKGMEKKAEKTICWEIHIERSSSHDTEGDVPNFPPSCSILLCCVVERIESSSSVCSIACQIYSGLPRAAPELVGHQFVVLLLNPCGRKAFTSATTSIHNYGRNAPNWLLVPRLGDILKPNLKYIHTHSSICTVCFLFNSLITLWIHWLWGHPWLAQFIPQPCQRAI